MKRAFELLETHHRDTISYYSRTKNAVKRFNDTLSKMLIKYCIDQLIKNWDKYLNQTLFAIRIRTHTTIDFSLFYFLYEINSHLSKNVSESISNRYDERIDSAFFFSRERAKTFKKTMQRAMKNKKIWDAKVKRKAFKSENMILIRIKKSKKFEVD